MTEQIKNLIIDGVEYQVETFSTTVQDILQVRERWVADLQKEKSAVLKTEAAIQQLDRELAAAVTKELKPQSNSEE